MCIICADMLGQFRRSDFLPEDLAVDRGLSASMRANGGNPLAFLDLDERGGSGPNGKASFGPVDAGAQITRTNLSWAPGLGQAATVTYSYRSNAPTPMPSDTSGFTRFTQTQIEATELMLLAWSDVARITFQRDGAGTSGEGAYSDNATMIFGNYSAGASGAAAFAYLPGSTSAASNAGNVWVNSSLSYNSAPTYLAYGYQVLLHEIGHAIGLSHPADYNAGPGVSITYSAHAIYYEDSRQYTVMSYFSESNTGGSFFGRYSSAPLLDDIAAAQRLYGANMTTRTGDTVYGFNSTADRIWFDATQGGGNQDVIFAVWDAGGTDTLDFSGYSQNGLIDLRQGHFSSVGRMTGNVSIAMGAVIENATGGGGNDTIIGNSADNRLRGLTGNDTLDGGAGSDTAVYAGPQANYTVTAGTEVVNGVSYRIVTVTGSEGTDVLRNIEFLAFSDGTIAAPTAAAGVIVEGDATADNITGTAFADWIYGADGADTINSGDGDDRVNGGRGNDNLNGGNGSDTVDYAGSSAGVTVNLTTGAATGGGGTDTLSNFENIGGTTRNDTLTGNGSANVINGAGGVDVLNGEGGNDTLIAGAGTLVGAEDVVKPSSQANLSIGTSVNIDGNFDLIDDAGVLNATTIPHAVIRGTSSGGGQEYYAVTVTAGQVCTFDIASATFDTTLRIFDAGGNQLAVNDDDDGSTNSLINHTFASSGTYYIAVGAYSSGSGASVVSGPPPFGAQYVLNVSVPGHPVVEAVGVGSTLNGGEGDDLLQGGISDDDINGGNGTDTAVFAGNRSAWTITDNGGGNFTISNGSQTDTLTGVEFAQFADQLVQLGVGMPTIDGTVDGDVLVGTDVAETINGLGGNDSMGGRGGDDELNGGDGNDILNGGLGADALNGGAGTDIAYYLSATSGVTINLTTGVHTGEAEGDTYSSVERWLLSNHADGWTGSGASETATGEGGNDSLAGLGGNDSLGGGAGDDILDGGDGDDTLNGGLGADQLIGGAGYDVVLYTLASSAVGINLTTGNAFGEATGDTFSSIERFLLTNYNDSFTGAGAADVVLGGLGGDTVNGMGGADILRGDDGNDMLDGGDGDDLLNGGAGADALIGGAGLDIAFYLQATSAVGINLTTGNGFGDAAGDTFSGIERWLLTNYNDFFTGAGGAETVTGGLGGDTLNGMDGDDLLSGEDGNDTLNGGDGNDQLNGGQGADSLTGGDGYDVAFYGLASSGVSINLVSGVHTGEALGDTFSSIERWQLSNHADSFIGTNAAEHVFGGSGNDDLRGQGGNDVLNGGAGNDILVGGTGNDRLDGGAGDDLFVFAAGWGADAITDFVAGAGSGDVIRFTTDLFADFNAVMAAAADTANGVVITSGANTITLTGVTLAQLTTGDFAFVAPSAPLEQDGKILGPQTLPGETLKDLFADDAIICPVFGDEVGKAPGDRPLVLPGEDKSADELPVVCDPGTDVALNSPHDGHRLADILASGTRERYADYDWII